jgi:hypothetical protein
MPFPIGSISHGTLRAEDLGPAFHNTARKLLRGRKRDEWTKKVMQAARAEDARGWTSEEADDIVAALIDLLTWLAPPYVYFGPHPGDGSDFGFWPDIESLEADTWDDGVLRIEAGDEVPREHRGYVMAVTDHGNVTLYHKSERGTREIWSCV